MAEEAAVLEANHRVVRDFLGSLSGGEFASDGTLANGDVYHNDYLFLFRVRDGRIAFVGEYFNPDVVREKIAPAMAAAMNAASQQHSGGSET